MVAPFSLFASCAPGLEPLLLDELGSLGLISPQVVAGGVIASGHRRAIYRVNYESGLATHLLVRVGTVTATHFADLEAGLVELPWERYLSPGVPRSIRVSAHKSRLMHTGAIAERTARSIAIHLGDDRVSPEDGGVPVQVRMERDRATLSIDTSGAPLHRRGYRLATGKAPLREDLARALVIASGWDREGPLVDPFCGAGTIGIEAARLAARLPNSGRSFAFERTPLFDAKDWEGVRARTATNSVARVVMGDRDPRMIDAARSNAERAGVEVELVCASVSELEFPEGSTVVTNPPYGQRLEGGPSLYRALGRRVRQHAERVAVLTSDRDLGMQVLPTLRTAFLTTSGGLRVRALVGAVNEQRPVAPEPVGQKPVAQKP
jgi:putative N6-adenine-specific DNA methylase